MTTEQRYAAVTNPFPGLRPFETHEYRLFFGREGQADALVERLERSRFLAIVGTSGSGKSSLVRAGLLPALRGGMMAGAGAGWRIAVLRPGHDPLGNLARSLAEAGVLAVETEEETAADETEEEKEARRRLRRAEGEAVVEATLRRGSLGLVEAAARARLGEREKLLVVVDQFEELFRFRAARAAAGATDDVAAAFVKLLLEAARQRKVPVYVVLTMRSDFLGDCAQFQGLPEAINDGQYLIPRMTRDERRYAITGPVRVARARMSEPLVNRLLNDVGDNPDQLPILQHALMRTWEHWSQQRRDSEPLGLEHYEAVGSMADALSLHADEAWGELPDERSRRVAETLFKALTERGADNREIRRPTRLGEICEIAGATPEEVASVVEVFRREGRSFLMPPADVPLTPDTVIDISHESLIRNWDRLREWVRDEAEGARIYRRLAEAAAAYRAGEGGLLDDVTLGWVNRWREKYEPNRAWGVRYHPGYDEAMAYLEESRAASEQRAAEARERDERELRQARAFAEQQARAARRMRSMMLAMAVLFLFAFGTAVFAMKARGDANDARQRAEGLANELKASFGAESEAKQQAQAHQRRAEEAQAKAEEERAHAEEERKHAEEERARAEAESRRADMEADLAAKHAQDERRAKEGLAAALAKSEAIKAASQFFRHAITDIDRATSNEEMADAHNRLNESIKKFESVGDYDGVAAAYVSLWKFDAPLIDPTTKEERTRKYLLKAVEYYMKDGNHGEAGETLESIADVFNERRATRPGKPMYVEEVHAEAIRRYEEAYREFGAAQPPYWAGMISVLRKAAATQQLSEDEADKRKATEKLRRAVELQRAHAPDSPTLPDDLFNLISLYRETEPPAKAEAAVGGLLAPAHPGGALAAELALLDELMKRGDPAEQHLRYVERRRQIYRQQGDTAGEVALLEKTADSLLSAEGAKRRGGEKVSRENTAKALEYYEAAMKYYEGRTATADFQKQVLLWDRIGDAHVLAGGARPALAAYSRALSLGREKQVLSPLAVANLLRIIADIQIETGQLAQAQETANQLREYLKTATVPANLLRAIERVFERLKKLEEQSPPSTPAPPRQP